MHFDRNTPSMMVHHLLQDCLTMGTFWQEPSRILSLVMPSWPESTLSVELAGVSDKYGSLSLRNVWHCMQTSFSLALSFIPHYLIIQQIVMGCPSSTKSIRSWTLRIGTKYWKWASTSTMKHVVRLSLDTPKSGKVQWPDWDDGSISRMITRPWMLALWRVCGGSFLNYSRKDSSTRDTKLCLTQLDAVPLFPTLKRQKTIKRWMTLR